MYDWLSDSLNNSGTVVTANRRVARALKDEFSVQQMHAGKKAWRSPLIYAWQDWLSRLASDVSDQNALPIRLNTIQSQVLWERCLRKEVDDSEARISNLVRMCRDSWQRLADWQIPITELARSTQSEDQRVFASVAGRYLALLERENWVDDAGIGSFLLSQIAAGRVQLSPRSRRCRKCNSIQYPIHERKGDKEAEKRDASAACRYKKEGEYYLEQGACE